MEEASTGSKPIKGQAALMPPPHTLRNDSGYSSDVLTSPETSQEDHKLHIPKSSDCLTPVVTRTVDRLTSTPCTSSNLEAYHRLLPKIKAISNCERIRHDSTSASPVSTTTHTLEMCELEITCRGTSTKNQQQPLEKQLKPLQKPQTPSTTRKPGLYVAQRVPVSRTISRIRKPHFAFVRILREAEYLVRKVLMHLSGCDLLCLSHVNKQLRDLILQDKTLNAKRLTYMSSRRTECDRVGKENFKLKRLNEGSSSSHPTLSPRKELSSIQNLCATSPKKPLMAPTTSLSDCFMEAAKKLPKGEELQKCVKCKSPAVVQKPQQRAVCSKRSCSYEYCISCHLPFHRRQQDCPVLRARTRQGTGIFSNKCKRNLRRL